MRQRRYVRGSVIGLQLRVRDGLLRSELHSELLFAIAMRERWFVFGVAIWLLVHVRAWFLRRQLYGDDQLLCGFAVFERCDVRRLDEQLQLFLCGWVLRCDVRWKLLRAVAVPERRNMCRWADQCHMCVCGGILRVDL